VGFGGDEDGARNRTGAAVLFASDKSLISPTVKQGIVLYTGQPATALYWSIGL